MKLEGFFVFFGSVLFYMVVGVVGVDLRKVGLSVAKGNEGVWFWVFEGKVFYSYILFFFVWVGDEFIVLFRGLGWGELGKLRFLESFLSLEFFLIVLFRGNMWS